MEGRNSLSDVRQRISLYFDNELDQKGQDDLLQEVNNNPTSSRIFQKEKNFRNFIKDNVKRPAVSPDFVQNIRNKVRVK